MNLDSDILKLKSIIVKHRQWLHRHPELDFNLKNTRDYILSILDGLDFDRIEVLCNTGIKAVMKAKNADKTLAFRADMDALPVYEETGLSFASENPGVMHGCGHDGHMSILLGLAYWLHNNKKDLRNNVVLIFQPAEETIGGAKPMIEAGVLDDPFVDAIFGFHIMPGIPEGMFGIKKGPLMAQTCEFDIELYGQGAHGAMPYLGKDTITASASLINSIQSIIPQRIDPFEQALITIGRLEAGCSRNVIADRAVMKGIIRTFNEDTYKIIRTSIKDLISGLKTTHGIEGKYIEHVYFPVVNNDDRWTKIVTDKIPEEKIYPVEPMMIAEDFSYYQKKIPGVYIFLGSRNETAGFDKPLHSGKFNFNEEILLLAVQLCKTILCG